MQSVMSQDTVSTEVTAHSHWILPARLRSKLDEHPIGKNLYITEIAFYPEHSVPEKAVLKNNPDFVLLYCVNGTGWYTLNNKKMTLTANHFALLPRKTYFQMGAEEGDEWSHYFVKFNGVIGEDMYNYLLKDKNNKDQTTPPLVGRIAQFRDIMHHLELMDNMENLIYANFRFYSFLGTFRLTVFNYMKKGTENIIERCILIMKQHLQKKPYPR